MEANAADELHPAVSATLRQVKREILSGNVFDLKRARRLLPPSFASQWIMHAWHAGNLLRMVCVNNLGEVWPNVAYFMLPANERGNVL